MSRQVPVVLLMALLLAGWPGVSPIRAQPPAAPAAPLKHPSLSELGKLCKSLDLPLPPKDAGFAILSNGRLPWQTDRNNPNPDSLHSLTSKFQFHFATEDPEIKGGYRVPAHSWQR